MIFLLFQNSIKKMIKVGIESNSCKYGYIDKRQTK